MQKIMVATDYSDGATTAVKYALALANRFGAHLTLVSAVEEPYSAAAGALVDIDEHIRDEAMETMTKVKAELEPRLKNGATVDMHTVDGDPGRVIPRVGRKHNYDLIVAGTAGSTAAREMFTGSVANGLIKHSDLPVLVVPNKLSERPIRRVVFAADKKKLAGKQILAPLTQLLRAAGPEAELIIYHHDDDGDGRGYDARLPDYLDGVRHRFEVHSGEGSPHENIDRAVDTYRADLLCMIYHDRGFFGSLFNQSTVSQVTFDATVPILVLPDA